MSFLASDVADDARVLLNDTAASLYTNVTLLAPIARANRELELVLISYGLPVQRQISAAIPVAANATELTLPTDFLLPISMKERNSGSTNVSDWQDMTEKEFEPTITITNTLTYWAFRDNRIKFPGANTAREVLLRYERQLAAITAISSPEDFVVSRNYLGAKTAEIAARSIGMNITHADDILARYVAPAEDGLVRCYVLNQQGIPTRRQKFQTKSLQIS
jgi:hypothetical protein